MRKIQHIESVDYLRFIMSVFVVIWHMKGAGTSLIFSSELYENHAFTLSDFINFHVLLLAVPAFICLSNYLFAAREPNRDYLFKRSKRLLLLLSFWTLTLLLYNYGIVNFCTIVPRSLSSLIVFVMSAGHTPFYFFTCLLLTTSLTYIALKLKNSVVFLLFLFSILLLLVTPVITIKTNIYPLSACWSPLNFIPYSFIAVLLCRYSDTIATRKTGIILLLFLASVIFALLEWNFYKGSIFFPGQGFAAPAYTRNSLVFSTTALLVLLLNTGIHSNALVRFFSMHALGIYCLHSFFEYPVRRALAAVIPSNMLSLCIAILLVLALSYTMSAVLRLYLTEDIIR